MKVVTSPEFDSLLPEQKFDRRSFLVSSLAAGFAAAVQPVSAQTITTNANGLVAGEIKIPVKDGEIPGYRAMPTSGGPFATVLVVQEIFGVHEHIRDLCRRFAKAGYFAIAPELYARQGDVSKISNTQEIVDNVVKKVPDAQVMGDLDAAAAYAKASGKGDTARLGITGFCWGGRIVWMYAVHNPGLKAAVAWYGPLDRSYYPGDKSVLDVVKDLKAPVLGLYGGADQGIPIDTVNKTRDALRAAKKPGDLIVYPDTPHGFNADYRPSYRKERRTTAGSACNPGSRCTVWFKFARDRSWSDRRPQRNFATGRLALPHPITCRAAWRLERPSKSLAPAQRSLNIAIRCVRMRRNSLCGMVSRLPVSQDARRVQVLLLTGVIHPWGAWMLDIAAKFRSSKIASSGRSAVSHELILAGAIARALQAVPGGAL
jgi:carboxymethylenebutenolidase